MSTADDEDVVAWSIEQAAMLRARNYSQLDIRHIADEVEDVGRSEQRELASRRTGLLAHLLKWRIQADRRGARWRGAIKEQRAEIADILDEAPSLRARMDDARWNDRTWTKAVGRAMAETGLADFPPRCPWTLEQILSSDFHPDGDDRLEDPDL